MEESLAIAVTVSFVSFRQQVARAATSRQNIAQNLLSDKKKKRVLYDKSIFAQRDPEAEAEATSQIITRS